MRSIVSLAGLAGMVLLNFLATGVGRARADFIKVPAPPRPVYKVGGSYEVFAHGATPDVVPADTVGYEFDLHFDTEILSLVSARDDLVGGAPIDISPLPDGLRLSAMGSRAVPDDLITTMVFSADRVGSTVITIDPLTYFVASGPGGEIVALLQAPIPGELPVNVVPEPSSIVLFGIGLALLTASARRRHSRHRPPDKNGSIEPIRGQSNTLPTYR